MERIEAALTVAGKKENIGHKIQQIKLIQNSIQGFYSTFRSF